MKNTTLSEILPEIERQITGKPRLGSVYILADETIQEVSIHKNGRVIRTEQNPIDLQKTIAKLSQERRDTIGFIPTTQEAYQTLVKSGSFWPIQPTSEIFGKEYVLYRETRSQQ
jgi:hypothetical protein